jgi:hypothetical protein
MKWLQMLLALFTITASAADINGAWKGTAETDNGTIERTFMFKVDGGKLTGETVSTRFGKSVIADGKIDGDNLTFTITMKFQDNTVKVSYKGKVVSATEIKMTAEIADAGQTIEYTAKKVS